MLPTISLGQLSISSYGIFLTAGFLFGVFLVWRLSRAWDLAEEKILDLTLLTFLGGLIGARILFVAQNFEYFGWDAVKWVSIHKWGGFSFFGVLLGGVLTLRYYSKKFKLNFWQAMDFASIGLLGGLFFASFGCFFAGCNIGVSSNMIFAINMVGTVGKRFPVQVLEAAFYLFALSRMWGKATHFHIQGTIAAAALIYIGAVMLVIEPLRQDFSYTWIILFILGLIFFYRVTKRNILRDFKYLILYLVKFLKEPALRKKQMESISKSWYNNGITIRWKIKGFLKILRRMNVRLSHKDSKYY